MIMASKKDTAGTELVPVKEQLPSVEMIDYGADAGDLGFTKDDLAVPFIRILQSNSPQLQRGNAKFVRDARAGDFFNSVTQDYFGGEEGILILPVHFVRSYTEWRPRESGGGLVQDHGSDEAILRQCQRTDKNKLVLPNGNYINEAAHYFVFQLLGDGQYTQGILPFASTQWRKARTWNTVMSGMVTKTPQGMRPLPMFATIWRLTTVAESNDAGDWMGYKITKHGPVHEHTDGRMVYEAARDFRQLVMSGAVQVKHEEDSAPNTPSNTNVRQTIDEGDNIPF
jgi:hypothetical protein